MVFAVIGSLILAQNVMSSADGKEKEFQLVEGKRDETASGNAVSEDEKTKEKDIKDEFQTEEKKDPQDTESPEKPSSEPKEEKQEEPELVTGASDSGEISSVITSFTKGKSSLGERVVSYAKAFQGVPYIYGGTDLPDVDSWTFSFEGTEEEMPELYEGKKGWQDEYGVDCSGFVMKVFEKFDIKLPRTVKEQAQQGTEVKIKDMKPGDIIFYGTSNAKITHCGIYAGEDKVIHVSARTEVVKISDMNYRRIAKVVRVVEEYMRQQQTLCRIHNVD